jgi:DHA2 family multidrug resistance protein-like MFS transporter
MTGARSARENAGDTVPPRVLGRPHRLASEQRLRRLEHEQLRVLTRPQHARGGDVVDEDVAGRQRRVPTALAADHGPAPEVAELDRPRVERADLRARARDRRGLRHHLRQRQRSQEVLTDEAAERPEVVGRPSEPQREEHGVRTLDPEVEPLARLHGAGVDDHGHDAIIAARSVAPPPAEGLPVILAAIEVPHFIHFAPAPAAHETIGDKRWLGLGVICCAMFISAIDMTIVNVALPEMSHELDAGIGELQWVLDAFLVSLAGLLLVGSGLADRFGRRRVFVMGLVGFAVTSVLTAASQTVGDVIASRALMGAAAACVLPPSLSLLAVLFPPELRPKALGIWAAVAGVALALGPVVGGVLVDVAGWRWIFLVNVPFVLVAAPLGLRWLPESRRPGAPPLDLPGVALSSVGLTGIVFALIEGVDAGWTSPAVLLAAVVGVTAVVAFFAVELRRADPLFDVRVLARARVAAGSLAIFNCYVATLGMLFLLPQRVQYVEDGSALASGAVIAPFGLMLGATASVSGRLVTRHGPRVVLLTGLLTAACGFVPLLLLSSDSSPALVLLGTAIVGGGIGLVGPSATTVVMNDLGLEKAGDGAAVNQLARQVGGALGVAIVGSVFAAIYAAQVTQGGGVPAAAKESVEDATRIASSLQGAARVELLDDALAAFDVAARWGLAVCMAALLLAAAGAAIGLSGTTAPAEEMTPSRARA